MRFLNTLRALFLPDDEAWMRHANPWSVWTRFLILPLFALSVWAQVWIGWYSLLAIGILVFWTWINPRAFNRPKTTRHWCSKAVFGERVMLQKTELPIPQHHTQAINILYLVTASGLPVLVWGLYAHQICPVLLGLGLVTLGKMWFLDRMVWLYQDMKTNSAEYASWEY